MNSTNRMFATAAMFAALTGCDGIAELSNAAHATAELSRTLGPYQYLGLDPQISFTIQKAQIDSGDPPMLTYTVGLRQNNASFPLKTYQVSLSAVLVDASGNVVDDTVYMIGTIDSGVGSISGVDKLYGRNAQFAALRTVHLNIEKYDWSPGRGFKPYASPQ